MEILIQPVGNVEEKVFLFLKEFLNDIFNIKCSISSNILKIPRESYNSSRNQYYSTIILSFLKNKIEEDSYHVIAVTDVDLYVPRLNFVFGEAECPGKYALISLYRLRHPEEKLFLNRVLKEAVHELGHTFGISHCENHLCVMHFSNSILETDIKGVEFCKRCLTKIKPI